MKKLILYSNVNSWHISRNLSLFEDLGYECRMFRWLDRDFFCRPFAIYLNWYENIKVGNIELKFDNPDIYQLEELIDAGNGEGS